MDTDQLKAISAQYGVAVVWDAGSNTARTLHKRRACDITDQWGNGGDNGDATLCPAHMQDTADRDVYYKKFQPGRDIQWQHNRQRAAQQVMMLHDSGLLTVDSMFAGGRPNPSNLFAGAQGNRDFANLIDVCHGRQAKQILDIAPDLFIAQELIHQTGEIDEEEFVELTARQNLAWTNYNTWMNRYRFDRIQRHGHGYSTSVDINSLAGIPIPKQSVTRTQEYRKLWHHTSGALWGMLELEQLAEARANGAPDIPIVKIYTEEAQLDIKRTENAMAYFGHPSLDMEGLLNHSEITHEIAAQQLGAGANPVLDRALFTDAVSAVIQGSVRKERVDKILVGTAAWLYLNNTLFFTVASGDSRTLLTVLMEGLNKLGVKSIEWAPEMEHDAAQATKLVNEHSFSTDLANAWAGGLATENVIAFISSSNAKGSVGVGKELGARPQEQFRGDVEVRYLASSGEFDVRKPAAYRILTNVGPA